MNVLKAKGYAILGVSADSPKRQLNFKNKFGFPYDLIADEDKQLLIHMEFGSQRNLWVRI